MTHKSFHTQKLLQTDTFTHRSLYTQTLLREIWGSYAIYVGIPSLILANGWELRHLCPFKRQLDVEKKNIHGGKQRRRLQKIAILVIFRDTWRNWPVKLNGSWAIYAPAFRAFDIDGATQDSERLLWHQSRTFQQKTGPPKWSISFYRPSFCIPAQKMNFFTIAHRRVPPTTGVVELWKKTSCNENQWNWGGVPQKRCDEYFHWGPIFYADVVLQGIGSLPCIRMYISYT